MFAFAAQQIKKKKIERQNWPLEMNTFLNL